MSPELGSSDAQDMKSTSAVGRSCIYGQTHQKRHSKGSDSKQQQTEGVYQQFPAHGKLHHRQGSRGLSLWLGFVMVVAFMYFFHIRLTQQLVQSQEASNSINSINSSSRSSESALQDFPRSGCDAQQRPGVAIMMVILGHDNETRHDQYWMAVANRRAYALQHNIPLYLVTDTMGSGQHPAWEKLVALQAVFQHSCAEWVWMSDADAYIMNIGLSVMDLVQHPQHHSNPKQLCNTSTPDIIAAGACLTRINTGSMLWRNNDWTRQFVSDSWHSKFIARPANWWDQAAILHMYKQGDAKYHICIVKQRSINAFPNMTGCHDGAGTFKDGDLLVHFPGGMKKAIANMNSKWLQAVPLLPHTLQDVSKHAPIFTVSRYVPDKASPVGHQVHVSLVSQLYAANSSQQVDFDLYIEPQQQGFSNWGWPIWPEPAQHKANLQRQLVQLQQQRHQQ